MNDQLQEFARKTLLDGLEKLPDGWQRKFKMMYGRKNGKRSVENTEKMSLIDVVNEIPPEKLDWAMTQIENSVRKIERGE